jgi:hypothetical protein
VKWLGTDCQTNRHPCLVAGLELRFAALGLLQSFLEGNDVRQSLTGVFSRSGLRRVSAQVDDIPAVYYPYLGFRCLLRGKAKFSHTRHLRL